MKKIIAISGMLLLSACVYAGEVDILESRRSILSLYDTYSIDFYDNEPRLVKSEYVDEKNFKFNTNLTAYKGYSVLNNKVYRKDYYINEYVKIDKNTVVNSASVADKISIKDKRKVIGVVVVDGVEYRLVPSSIENFVFLVKPNGEIYKKMGQIRDGRLAIVISDFYPRPEDARFVTVSSSKTEQTKPTSGFDVKYEGVKLDRIWFTYLDYSATQGAKGTFENISFPNKQGLIEINGIGFRVLNADDLKIDYIVIK